MKTTDIKGRPYIEVNERLKHFRANHPDHALISEIVSNENGVVIMKAVIFDGTERAVAVGHAYEKEGSTFINKTSYIENCETSAWGRALANFGIGIDAAVASADEVQNAQANQPSSETKKSPENDAPALTDDELLGSIKEAATKEKLPWDDFEGFVLSKKGVENWTHDVLVSTHKNITNAIKAYRAHIKEAK